MSQVFKVTPQTLLDAWRRLSALPAGKGAFSRLLGFVVPYSGTVHGLVETLEPGHSVVRLRDRRRVRNHLKSVHAMALANLGELSTGLALMTSIPDTARGILTGYSIEYLKKARGTLTAECRTDLMSSVTERVTRHVEATIRNADGEAVATVRAQWLVGP